MEIKNNPVGRLRMMMDSLRCNALDDERLNKIWARLLQCSETDTQTIFKGITAIFALNSDARHATEKLLPDSPEFFSEPFDKIDKLLSNMAMHTFWRSVSPMVDNTTMTALAFIEHSLDSHYTSPAIGTNEKIAALTYKLDELIEACLESKLSAELSSLFVRQLQALRSALFEFRIFGPDGLEDALNQASGSILRNQATIKDELAAGNGIVEQFFEVLGKANDLISGYQTAVPAIAPITAMLLNILK